MKIIKTLLVGIFRLGYFIPVLGVIIFLVLLFGHKILGPLLPGSDNANFITLAKWLSDWFPKIPFWYPQQGGGMSFTISYPILNHIIIVLIEKITQQPIAVVFRVWSLITVVLSSLGLYLLSFRLTKNQTISSIAAIFYPLMPITWIFLIGWGFSAEQLSLMFIPPVLIFLSLFLDEFYEFGLTAKSKIYFLLFILLFATLPFAHPLLFIGVLMYTAILFIVYPLLNYNSGELKLKKVIIVGILSTTVMIVATLYWVLPFFRYQSIAGQGAPVEKEIYNHGAFLQNGIYPLSVFSITDRLAVYESYDDPAQNVSGSAWRNASFPFIISLLALIGLLGSLFLNRKVFAFGLANLLPLAIAIFPQWTYYLIGVPLSGYFLNWRAAIVASRFIIPLLAAFGCYAISYMLTFPLDLLSKKVKTVAIKYPIKILFIFLSTVMTVIVASILLWEFKSHPNKYPDFLLSYGPEVIVPSERVDLRNVWRREVDYCFAGSSLTDVLENYRLSCSNYTLQKYFWTEKLNKACIGLSGESNSLPSEIALLCSNSNPTGEVVKRAVDKCNKDAGGIYAEICKARTDSFWNQVKPESWIAMLKSKELFTEGSQIFDKRREILDALPNNANTRIDMDTYLGTFMMIEPFYSQVPQLPVYYNQATLIKTLWNYQISVFNQKESVWPQDSVMDELSKYFGLEYMLLSEDLVPLDKYERTGWERIRLGVGWRNLALWKYNQPVSLLRATTKPLILVIGQDKVDGYFRVFHLANLGALPFEEALVVKGGSYVDSYSVDELKKFDAVVLEGYSYKNRPKGWKILDEYVKKGGSLLINTGWQYSSADWQVSKTPEFFPLKTLEWTDAGMTNNYKNEDSEIAGEVDIEKFNPLIYGDKPWSISSSERSGLRAWGKVAISANGKPLIAGGEYGLGKVVWLGFDLPGHIGNYDDNIEEVKLYENLLSYLLKTKEGKILNASFVRNYPDKLEITINESSSQKVAVYWSEAYYPDFKAKLVTGNKSEKLKVYKAGPGMTLFILPNTKAGSKIIYEYKTPISIMLAKLISLIMLTTLIIMIVKPQLLNRIVEIFSKKIWAGRLKKRIFGEQSDENLNY